MRKLKWKQPKLIILVRGKPEELALSGCKLLGGGEGGPDNSQSMCQTGPHQEWEEGCQPSACSADSPS